MLPLLKNGNAQTQVAGASLNPKKLPTAGAWQTAAAIFNADNSDADGKKADDKPPEKKKSPGPSVVVIEKCDAPFGLHADDLLRQWARRKADRQERPGNDTQHFSPVETSNGASFSHSRWFQVGAVALAAGTLALAAVAASRLGKGSLLKSAKKLIGKTGLLQAMETGAGRTGLLAGGRNLLSKAGDFLKIAFVETPKESVGGLVSQLRKGARGAASFFKDVKLGAQSIGGNGFGLRGPGGLRTYLAHEASMLEKETASAVQPNLLQRLQEKGSRLLGMGRDSERNAIETEFRAFQGLLRWDDVPERNTGWYNPFEWYRRLRSLPKFRKDVIGTWARTQLTPQEIASIRREHLRQLKYLHDYAANRENRLYANIHNLIDAELQAVKAGRKTDLMQGTTTANNLIDVEKFRLKLPLFPYHGTKGEEILGADLLTHADVRFLYLFDNTIKNGDYYERYVRRVPFPDVKLQRAKALANKLTEELVQERRNGVQEIDYKILIKQVEKNFDETASAGVSTPAASKAISGRPNGGAATSVKSESSKTVIVEPVTGKTAPPESHIKEPQEPNLATEEMAYGGQAREDALYEQALKERYVVHGNTRQRIQGGWRYPPKKVPY